MPFKKILPHFTVNHSAKQYVDGKIHTNTIESFWALLKISIKGQFHFITTKYLDLYLNEFTFRYNNRDDKSMFDLLIKNMLMI